MVDMLAVDTIVVAASQACNGELGGLETAVADFAPRLGSPCSHPHRSAEAG